MAILAITRITSHRSTSNRRYWSLYSESQAQMAVVFVEDLAMEPWLEEEAARLRDLLAEVPEDGTKILEIPVMVKVLQDGDYYQVDRVVKGPESAEIRPKPKDAGQDWIAEIAAQIQEQVIVLQATIQAQQARIAELENEATDKQRSIDELTATVQTQQARVTALENEADRAKAEYLPAESPVESVTEDEEDGAWSAAKLFHSVDPALVDEDVDDLPVPLRLSVDEIGKSASEIRTERLMHPNRAHVVLCYEASMDLTPHPEYIEALSVFIETCKDGQYLNYSQAGLPQAQVDHLYLAGMLECSPAASYKLRPSAAGETWYCQHTTSQAQAQAARQEIVIDSSKVEQIRKKADEARDILSDDDAAVDTPVEVICRSSKKMAGLCATGPYMGKLRQAIIDFKYKGAVELAKPLAERLVTVLERRKWAFDIIVPVPLSDERLSERGYNQANLLGRQVAKQMNIPCRSDALRRIRDTDQQTWLNAKQWVENVKNAFAAGAYVDNRSVLLIDDVMATGSTLEACADALKLAGVKAVHAIAVAKTTRY